MRPNSEAIQSASISLPFLPRRVLGSDVLLKLEADALRTKAGLHLPVGTTVVDVRFGEVILVGSGSVSTAGVRIEPEVKAGDRVFYSRGVGLELRVDGEDVPYALVPASRILGVM